MSQSAFRFVPDYMSQRGSLYGQDQVIYRNKNRIIINTSNLAQLKWQSFAAWRIYIRRFSSCSDTCMLIVVKASDIKDGLSPQERVREQIGCVRESGIKSCLKEHMSSMTKHRKPKKEMLSIVHFTFIYYWILEVALFLPMREL